ncbi:MAG: DNA-binding domain-containing protein [Nevskia sp.]
MSSQAAFSAALLAPQAPLPEGLVVPNGADAAARYAVHRNNIAVSLLAALAATFPACREELGEPRFRELGLRFLRAAPPRSAMLSAYGEAFPAFLAQAEPEGRTRPELAELARLEWLRVQCFHAADAAPLPAAQWHARLAAPEALPGLRCALHPALRLFESARPVVALWAAQQAADTAARIAPATAGQAVIARSDAGDVLVLPVARGLLVLLQALAEGRALGPAAEAGSARDAAFDLPAALAFLIGNGLVVALQGP